MEYKKLGEYDTSLSGSEGQRYELIDCEIINPIDQTLLAGLIAEHHGDDEFESYQSNDYGREFESEFSSWLEVYNAILNGDTVDTVQHIRTDVFVELHDKGMISNCWVSSLRYYQTKYRDYQIADTAPARLVDDGKEAFTERELIAELLKQNKIQHLADGFYTKS